MLQREFNPCQICMIDQMRRMSKAIFYYITAFPLGLLGKFLLSAWSEKQDCTEWPAAINGKTVLILGSGPSSKGFDVVVKDQAPDLVVYINHAIGQFKKETASVFFTTDVNRAKEVSRQHGGLINLIDKKFRIVAPIAPSLTPIAAFNIKSDFTWIGAQKYHLSVRCFGPSLRLGPFKLCVPLLYFSPEKLSRQLLLKWKSHKQQSHCFPVLPPTSALSALLFCAKYHPRQILLLGCEFRDPHTQSSQDNDRFAGANTSFQLISQFLSQQGVVVNNLSTNC